MWNKRDDFKDVYRDTTRGKGLEGGKGIIGNDLQTATSQTHNISYPDTLTDARAFNHDRITRR